MNDFTRWVSAVEAVTGKKRGRHPVFNANQFYPHGVELELRKLTRDELSRFLSECADAATIGFEDDLNEVSGVPEANPEDVDSRLGAAADKVKAAASADFVKWSEMLVGKPYFPPEARGEIFKTWKQNFQILCKSAKADIKKDISLTVQTAKNEGWNKERLRKEIASRLEGKYKARAENIARTELGKLNSAARLSQYNEVGIKYYRWLTTIDGRERQSHRAMNGVICSVSNPHVYYTENANAPLHPIEHYRTAEMFHGNPGEDFQCRCSMVAWDPEIDGMYQVRRLTKEELMAGSELKATDVGTFAKKIEEAKRTQAKVDWWRVTTETAAEFEKDHPGSTYFCTKGGSVAAVSPDGDIFGVCKSLKDGDSAGKYILANAVKAGGKKLDSYEGNHKFYARNGFEPISWCKWDPDFAPEDWKTTEAFKMAKPEDIIFYAYTGKAGKYETAESFKAAVPASADYGEAMAKRDKILKTYEDMQRYLREGSELIKQVPEKMKHAAITTNLKNALLDLTYYSQNVNGIEKIRDLSSREAKYLDDLINTAKIYRLNFIATKR